MKRYIVWQDGNAWHALLLQREVTPGERAQGCRDRLWAADWAGLRRLMVENDALIASTHTLLRSRAVPTVPGYTAWYDPEADCYRAHRDGGLPDAAILAGGFVRLRAESAYGLKQACARNDRLIAKANAGALT